MVDETAGLRHKITTIFGNSYLFISEHDIMLTIAEENQHQHAQLRATTEACCRLASKAMKLGLPMAEIAEQFRKADSGRNTILTEIAGKMEEYILSEKQQKNDA